MVSSINSFESVREKFIAQLQMAGITPEEFETAQSQGTSAFEQLLQAHGISEADLPTETMPPDNGGHEEFMQKLQAAGITKEQFETAKAQGHDAVRELLESHGIEPKKGMHKCHKQSAGDDDLVQKLEDAGITVADLQAALRQGPQAVQQLFQAHGLDTGNGLGS